MTDIYTVYYRYDDGFEAFFRDKKEADKLCAWMNAKKLVADAEAGIKSSGVYSVSSIELEESADNYIAKLTWGGEK